VSNLEPIVNVINPRAFLEGLLFGHTVVRRCAKCLKLYATAPPTEQSDRPFVCANHARRRRK
jgi:hypothetical protein